MGNNFSFDNVEWRRVIEPDFKQFRIDFEYSLMGYDISLGRLDMLLRYAPEKSYCRRHRHLASTMTLVLDGEQHLTEFQDNGTTREIYRKKGDYALAKADALPHLEHGGKFGGTVMLSLLTHDGNLFEYFGEHPEDSWKISIEDYVKNWKDGVIYGSRPI